MKLIVPDNNDPDLISAFSDLINQDSVHIIKSVYGKPTPSKHYGTGRANILFDDISQNDTIERVNAYKELNVDYEYAMNGILPNARILNNRNHIIEELKWLETSPIKKLIIANYELAQLAIKYAPSLKLIISTYAGIDNKVKLLQWSKLANIHMVVLDRSIYRKVGELSEISKEAKKLGILTCVVANLGCMTNCIRAEEHAIVKDMASNNRNSLHYAPCTFFCLKYLLENPVEFLKLPIFRPEDLTVLDDIGIDFVKLVDRTQTTEWIKNVVSHYLYGTYNDNILDLTCNFTREDVDEMTNEQVASIDMKDTICKRAKVVQYRKILPELMKVTIDKNFSFINCGKNCEECRDRCKFTSSVKYDIERRNIVLDQLNFLENEYLFK
ncbi:U32 family peptidase [uncultured Draconibacterium sp.]|uniref:U32 family peptidase n=1 Tax=uncultured Draconibacterium sp. TaxID=1573823 RepID=UPI002AA8FD4A|nr:U32 family peptidase [uncultured Draconibacterium sp.]